ncbi:type IX secretion system membrane protein PorP/SprF [Cellulophaga sp. 20_2_10]|uniref:PorP/SprF family type IX secretion system membrane protein n=1 Tax=Cellulophaga sp. 20_2_10 TaxID=2942476 RepID=UPI00201AD523|nr:type IX secretion system membrane protein PorP/SprF [Cellulophaga sp. 20_2_10]MCL5246208.1 type IX secretion system membrane protein PorP/SprF [Cellulophaga sp. 20_2_10]
MNLTKNIKHLVLVVILCSISIANAQQAPQYTQYMYNTMSLNSGYTGTGGNLEATVLHRSQWVGLDGAPTSQSFSIQGKLKERIGVGLSAINDKLGASNNIVVNANFAYELPLGYTTKLSLGLNAGLDILNIDWSKGSYSNNLDPIFNQNNKDVRPVLGIGAFMYGTKWYAGLSTQNLFNSEIYNDKDDIVTDRKSQYYAMAGYVFDLSRNLKFKPSILTKHVSGAPVTVDVSGNFLINEKFSLGAAYRYDDAVSALAGFHITKELFLGYAYDYSLTDLGDYNNGSHEIILKYSVFNSKKRALSPRFF